MRVLIVDDSVVFRSQIKAALEGAALIEIAGTANNGKIALQRLAQSSVDLVTLDMEMPEMSGLETIREIRKAKFPVRVIIFSSHTTRGSELALEALAAGADDFVAKPTGESISMESASERIRNELLPKIFQFAESHASKELSSKKPETARPPIFSTPPSTPSQSYTKKGLETFRPDVIVIGSSTGGPPALEKVLTGITVPIRCPILIAQHMPPIFTASLAKRLQEVTGVPAAEAKDQEELQNGKIYIAPGNYHLSIVKGPLGVRLKLDQGPPRNSVRPAVDTLFESAAQCYGSKCMGFVLTGMGEDGLQGAKIIKQGLGGVMIQDRLSSVVFGMPGAVYQSGAYDEMGNLSSINSMIRNMTT